MRILRLVLCFIFVTSSMSTTAQVLTVTNSPRAFSVATPTSWLLRPVSTGNSRIKFSSPSGTPSAECSVISKEFAGLSGLPQEYFDSIILKQTSAAERTDQLAARYNNVRVWGVAFTSVSGFPGHSGLVWTIGCGGSGRTLDEANRSFSFWQNEISVFATNIRIL